MNNEEIYAKTREGEEAVHQRTRLVQRNLRTVLILIDGKSSVKELMAKAGGEDVLLTALEQLERDGFIRLVSGTSTAPGGVDAGSMANYLEPATDEAYPSLPPADAKGGTPFSTPSSEVAVNPFAPPPVAAKARPAPVAPSIDGVSISPFSIAAVEKPSASAVSNPFQASSSPFGAPPPPKAAPQVSAPPAPSALEPEDQPSQEIPSPTSFKRHGRLFTGQRLLIGGAGLILALVATVIFYPYDSHRPQVEAALTELVGQPVTIASVGASFFPGPALVLSQVSMGMGSDGGGVTISEMRAVPSIGALLTGRKSFSRVTLRGTQVPMAQLGRVASGLSAAGQSRVFSVGRLDLDVMTLALRDITFQDYSGRAELAPDGSLKQMNLQSKDGTMSIQVGPGASAKDPTQVLVKGQGWKSGQNSPFLFDSLEINGQLSGTRFVAEKIEGRIFGGVVQGQLQLDWSGGMLVAGDVNVDYMNAPQLASALGSGSVSVEGQVSARVRFRAAGESWSAIAGKVPLEGNFLAKSGVINGLDFVEAVRRGGKLATRGGATRYEQMVGKFRWDGGVLQLSEVDLASGPVRATGAVAVLKGGNLTGSISVALQSSASTIRTPVSVVGTLKDPQLFGGRN